MAKVYIAEYAALFRDHGLGGGAAQEPAILDQAVLDTTGGVQTSAAFNPNTKAIRVHTDGIISIVVGATPVASTASKRLAANSTEYFGVSPGHKLSAITNT